MFIRVNPRDNVAILVHPEGAAPGDLLSDGLVARERIPQSHKIALRPIEPGQPVLRYGQTIGLANRPIAAGSWVREELLDMPAAPPLDALPLATAVPPTLRSTPDAHPAPRRDRRGSTRRAARPRPARGGVARGPIPPAGA